MWLRTYEEHQGRYRAQYLINQIPLRGGVIVRQPTDESLLFNASYQLSPWGPGGGDYYGRIAQLAGAQVDGVPDGRGALCGGRRRASCS
jgi:hypothetical protein